MQKMDSLFEKIVQEDQRSVQPKFNSEGTPWECYKKHKKDIRPKDKNIRLEDL